MVLSTLALVGIIQLFLLLAGGIFFLFLHTRFLKKQIRTLRGEDQEETAPPPAVAAMTETEAVSPDDQEKPQEASPDDHADDTKAESAPKINPVESPQPIEGEGFIPVSTDSDETDDMKVTGEISELRKMLNEKLLLTANLRKLIEGLLNNPETAEDIAAQQTSSLLHLEEYIKLSRKEAAAVEEKITHYREQLAKAKKLINRYKEQHEQDIKLLEEEHQAHDAQPAAPKDNENPDTPDQPKA